MHVPKKLTIIICGNRAEFDKYRQWKRIPKGDPWVRYVGRVQELNGLTRGLRDDQAVVIYFGNYWLNPLVGDWRLGRFEQVKL